MSGFFDSSAFMPHGHCYLWKPLILWMHIGSDALVAISYFSIPVALGYYIVRSKNSGRLFTSVAVLFILFITLCGSTHVMSIWTTWNPNYWLEGVLKVLTAVASVVTAVALWPLIPIALKIPTPEALRNANLQLQDLNSSLEQRVADRTAESNKKAKVLEATNNRLESFQQLTLGREEKMIELKKEINELCARMGESARYEIPKV